MTGPLTVTQVHHRVTGLVYDLGGSAVADHAGLTDAWPRVLDVLR